MNETSSFEAVLERARAGDVEAQNEVGRHLAASGARAEAEQWFRYAAERGLAKAMHNLGVLYWNEDAASHEAINWFRAAAAQGWLPSIYILGAMYEQRGDLDTARRLYLTAAQQGHADSQDAVSRLHFDLDTEEDNELARQWAEVAADQGVAAAIARLGIIYHEGRGTPRDPSRAASYLLRAANLGHPGAQMFIGVLLHMGIGVNADRIEAAHWLLRSAEQGNEIAISYLQAKAGMMDLPEHEFEEARRRARQPLPWPPSTAT